MSIFPGLVPDLQCFLWKCCYQDPPSFTSVSSAVICLRLGNRNGSFAQDSWSIYLSSTNRISDLQLRCDFPAGSRTAEEWRDWVSPRPDGRWAAGVRASMWGYACQWLSTFSEHQVKALDLSYTFQTPREDTWERFLMLLFLAHRNEKGCVLPAFFLFFVEKYNCVLLTVGLCYSNSCPDPAFSGFYHHRLTHHLSPLPASHVSILILFPPKLQFTLHCLYYLKYFIDHTFSNAVPGLKTYVLIMVHIYILILLMTL